MKYQFSHLPHLFVGRLTKDRVKSLPGHFFLLSNIGDPFNSASELEVHQETSREVIWRQIAARNLNGRTFSAFRVRESLESEKLARWRGALQQFGICELMRIFTQIRLTGQSAPTTPSDRMQSLCTTNPIK
ncbi:MAG: hypothetical protein WAM85_21210 [Terracidiphilus sp.]